MDMKRIKVLIVDDHLMVRKGLVAFVNGFADMQLAAETGNPAHVLDLYETHRPDVVLMDMVLPNASGADLISQIRQRHPEAAIIALTSFGEEELVRAALRAGAQGFLYKNISVDELAEAIRQTHHGRMILDPKASDVMLEMVNLNEKKHPLPIKFDLSEREKTVLTLLVEGLTNKQIAAQLGLQVSTIKLYISNIFRKLNAQSRAEAVATALRLGLTQ